MAKSVFVSGATGFIAQHIVKDLINQGYKVVGSVRSSEKGDELAKNLNSDNFTYEIVKDIAMPNAFDESLKKHPEVEYFMHTASPCRFDSTDVENELLIPALEGTRNAFKSIKNYGPQIKAAVITSSIVAMNDLSFKTTVDETSWSTMTWERALETPLNGYLGSKTFAEKAAWEFMEKEKPNFTLNSVNPSYVFGPQAFDSAVQKDVLNTTSEMLSGIVKLNKHDKVPGFSGTFVDVRDVSKLHIYAIEHDIKNFRFIACNQPFNAQCLLNIIRENFPQLREKLPVGEPENGKNVAGRPIDNSKTRKFYGNFIPLETCVIDSIGQILRKNETQCS